MVKSLMMGQGGGPTRVINYSAAGTLAHARQLDWKVSGMVNGLQGLLSPDTEENVIDLTDVDVGAFMHHGPGAALGTTRFKPKKGELKTIATRLEQLGVDAVVYIGGNDSAAMLQELVQYTAIQLIHGIKTIDNDLPVTHHCPGFGSAALFNATTIKALSNDFSGFRVASNHKSIGRDLPKWDTAPVIIYQAMGRGTGWLTHGTAFAKVDPRGILVPDRPPHIFVSWETPLDKSEFLARVQDVVDRFGTATIVVGEEIRLAGKRPRNLADVIAKSAGTELPLDEHEHVICGAADSVSSASYLAGLIAEDLDLKSVVKTTAIVPQHIQRSMMLSPVDASDAYRVGWSAVEAVAQGQTGQSVILGRHASRTTTALTPVSTIAYQVRHVEPNYLCGLDGPTQEFVDEFIDLIGGPMAIPHYTTLPTHSVV